MKTKEVIKLLEADGWSQLRTQDYMEEMERFHGCFNEAAAALTAECSEGDKSVIIQGIKEHHESNCIKLVENIPNIEMPVPK